MKKRVTPINGWYYLINGKRFKIAYHGLFKWYKGGWRIASPPAPAAGPHQNVTSSILNG